MFHFLGRYGRFLGNPNAEALCNQIIPRKLLRALSGRGTDALRTGELASYGRFGHFFSTLKCSDKNVIIDREEYNKEFETSVRPVRYSTCHVKKSRKESAHSPPSGPLPLQPFRASPGGRDHEGHILIPQSPFNALFESLNVLQEEPQGFLVDVLPHLASKMCLADGIEVLFSLMPEYR